MASAWLASTRAVCISDYHLPPASNWVFDITMVHVAVPATSAQKLLPYLTVSKNHLSVTEKFDFTSLVLSCVLFTVSKL